jgi:RNA polymerase sigma-70 factor (ECF subfamily)
VRCKRRIGGYIKERKNIDLEEIADMPDTFEAKPADSAEKVAVFSALEQLGQQKG